MLLYELEHYSASKRFKNQENGTNQIIASRILSLLFNVILNAPDNSLRNIVFFFINAPVIKMPVKKQNPT